MKLHSKWAGISLAVTLLVASMAGIYVTTLNGDDDNTPSVGESSFEHDHAREDLIDGHGYEPGFYVLYNDTTLQRNQVAVIVSAVADGSSRGVVLRNHEAGSVADDWFYSTSFDVFSLGSVDDFGKLYVFGGKYDSDISVIERWQFRQPEGEFLKRAVLVRERIYQGTDFIDPWNARIDVDPEERFVGITHGTAERHFDQYYPSNSQIVRCATGGYGLGHMLSSAHPVEHAVDGRAWIGSIQGSTDVLVLNDSDNDTVFESSQVMDQQARVTLGYEYSDIAPSLYQVTDYFTGDL